MVKLIKKETRKSYLGQDFFYLASVNQLNSCQKLPIELTAKVAVIWRLSSTPYIGTFLEPLKLKVYFPGKAYDKKV